jgi:hypothetical protein
MLREVPELRVFEHNELKQMTATKRKKVAWRWKNILYSKKFMIFSLHRILQ